MARPIDRIEREIAELEKAIATLAQEFDSVYTSYLAALGQTIRQQLAVAAYHVCTQGYPEQFLSLSVSGRQKLQAALRQLGKTTMVQLQNLMTTAWETEEEDVLAAGEEANPELLAPDAELDAATEPSSELSSESSPESELEPESTPNSWLPTVPPRLNLALKELSKPEDLARSQDYLEKTLQELIYAISRDANRLLRQANIIPNQLPEPILEAAQSASAGEVVTAGPPNILNLWIETEAPPPKATSLDEALREVAASLNAEVNGLEEKPEPPEPDNFSLPNLKMPLRLVAIHLRLSELEFVDANLAIWRQKIRTLRNQLNSLGRDYHKKQRELAVAQAEAAWRALWCED